MQGQGYIPQGHPLQQPPPPMLAAGQQMVQPMKPTVPTKSLYKLICKHILKHMSNNSLHLSHENYDDGGNTSNTSNTSNVQPIIMDL